MRLIPVLFFSSLALLPLHSYAQTEKPASETTANGNGDDLLKELEGEETATKEYTSATFKTTRLINGHSIENTGKGVLDFRISHRFGELKSGFSGFFGLDGANTRIGFDYGVTDWLTTGAGRNTYDKEFDGFAKVKLLRQTENNSMPLSVSYVGAMSIQTMQTPELVPGEKYYFSHRLYYVNQLLIARKFSQLLSLQLMPTHVHYNYVMTNEEPNDMFAIGAGGRLKLSNRVSFNVEYYHLLGDKKLLDGSGQKVRNSLSAGFDIETGGHVFQLMFTNASTMTERAFIGGPGNADIGDGGVHFGFNISRVFTIVRPKEFRNSKTTW